MKKYTLVFEFEDGKAPEISAATEFMGGRCCGLQFSDALKELEDAEDRIAILEQKLALYE